MTITRVESYRTDDGITHDTVQAAVAHDIQRALEDCSAEGHISLRVLAGQITENPALRAKLSNLMDVLK